jgi:hypothetical protein
VEKGLLMPNIKISELPAASAASTSQEFEVNDSGTSKKVTGSQIKTFVKDGLLVSDVTDLTASVAELNTLDGLTASTAELNILDGVTSSTTELNILDGVSATQAPLVLTQPSAFVDPENRIINGAFDFWQRGTSSTGAGYVAADRWFNQQVGGTVTMSRQSHTVGDKFGSNAPQFYLRQTVSGQSGTASARIRQSVEGVRSYEGETITVLGWARRSSGSGNMLVRTFQDFGTGGSPSAAVVTAQELVTLSGSWAPFAIPISVPSITGKTLGSDGNDRLVLDITTSGSTDSIGIQTIGVDLWGIHIKRGTHTTAATDFYKAPELGPELVRCQRYFQRYTAFFNEVGYAAFATTGYNFRRNLVGVMRTAPSVSVGAASTTNCTIGTVTGVSTETLNFPVTNTAAGNWVANLNTVNVDAEL